MKKSLYTLFILLFCIILSSCASASYIKHQNNKNNRQDMILNNENIDAQNTTITMYDIAQFLETKKEHYPLSDEFIERYQQKSGGYIENARKAGLTVNKYLHEPNQKWHFFESWLYPSIEEGTMEWNESAKSRVYSLLQCPELVLWIYEACEVSPAKVSQAKKIAEKLKVEGKATSTIASQMRKIVLWDDLEPAIREFMEQDVEKFDVIVNEKEGFVISGLQDQYAEGREVSFTVNLTDSTKEVAEVKVNDVVISPYSGTKYKFTMPGEEVTIDVTLKEKEIVTPPEGENSGTKYNVKYDLGTRKTAKLLESTDDLLNALMFSGTGASLIASISQMEYIYGGGNGGSGDGKWYAGDMLKFGTTSVNGSMTIELHQKVKGIIIQGYTTNNASIMQVGDSLSLDWVDGEANDNKTAKVTLSEMILTSKEAIEGKQTSSIEISFASTKTVKIASTNKKPFYITSIEFILDN